MTCRFLLEARFQHLVHEVELVAVVEAEGKLMEIAQQILGGNLVIDTLSHSSPSCASSAFSVPLW